MDELAGRLNALMVRALGRLIPLIAVSLMVALSPARADRPSAPSNLLVRECNPPKVSGADVCVSFHNDSDERVYFELEWTENGVPPATLPEIDCHPKMIGNASGEGKTVQKRHLMYLCDAVGHWKRGIPDESEGLLDCFIATIRESRCPGSWVKGKTGDLDEAGEQGIPPQGLAVKGLDYQTTYCARVRVRRASDQMVSVPWTGWECTMTGEPPKRPSGRLNPTFEYIPGGADWRDEPPKVKAKWSKVDGADSYEVRSRRSDEALGGAVITVKGWDADQPFYSEERELSLADVQAIESSQRDIYFQVCAINEVGSYCSSEVGLSPIVEALVRTRDLGQTVSEMSDRLRQPGVGDIEKLPSPVEQASPSKRPSRASGSVLQTPPVKAPQ